ncbi:GFA family protein [Noviherbaspirillum sp.]|uniref:GFA family protein n=1 Tax=Noviherbaspirillum sp. TaxID=1926288 RepID=UPI002B473821|nr:GFA family protein [Noviherbaspirillum sp.]
MLDAIRLRRGHSMGEAMKGSCLCGAIDYEIDQLDAPIAHCHCRTCRKAHAAAFASTAGVMREHFRWVKGKEKLATFESSPGKLRHFCSVCGSHLMAERLAQPHVIVRVATLDEDPGFRPAMHIWCSHDVRWLHCEEDIPSYQEWQPGR